MKFKNFINEAAKVPAEVLNRLSQLDKLIKKAKTEEKLKELQQEKNLLMNKWFNKDYKEEEPKPAEEEIEDDQQDSELDGPVGPKDYNPPVGTSIDSIRQGLKAKGIRSAHDPYYSSSDFEYNSNKQSTSNRTFSKQKTLEILRNFTQQIDGNEKKISNYVNKIAPGLSPELNKTYKQFKQTLIRIIQNAGK